MFKDDFPDWFPVNDLRVGGESNDSGFSAVINAQQPTTTTPTPAPAPHAVMDDCEQLFNDKPLVFDPEPAKECGGVEGWFPLTIEAGFDVSVV